MKIKSKLKIIKLFLQYTYRILFLSLITSLIEIAFVLMPFTKGGNPRNEGSYL